MVGRNLVDTAPDHVRLLTPTSQELNLLDSNQTHSYIREHAPDVIIHTAGIVGGIQANMADPVKFLLENTDMGRNIVWAAKENGVKRLLNLGSSCMYPKDFDGHLKEEMVLTGQLEPTNEGYAIAKIFTQRLCSYISGQYGLSYKTIIPCNLYGAYDKFNPKNSHMIPAVIHKIHQAKEKGDTSVEIWGDGEARREFMFAQDLCAMIWKIMADFDSIPDVMNVGLGHDYSINEYYQTIAKVVGYNGTYHHDLSKPVGMKRKLVDVSLQTALDLSPNHTLEEGIQKTYEHYLQIKHTFE